MLPASVIGAQLEQMTPEQLRSALAALLPTGASEAERVAEVEKALGSPAGRAVRAAMGRWVVEKLVPPEHLVPAPYAHWRPVVRDAMLFVVTHLSDARLAAKLIEQLDLAPGSRAETRLLQLIARVPGLQKLGQVLARNRNLRPSLRKSLTHLENSIRDVEPAEIRAIVREQLGTRLTKYQVRIAPRLMSEASVSAVMRFTWENPESGRRERGVFKVMKPHIALCFSEDMRLLQSLTRFFGGKLHVYGFGAGVLPDTFAKVRRLLQHEVNFPGEQATLVHAERMYRGVSRTRVPRLIAPLCTRQITAISEERGVKITSAAAHMTPAQRERLTEQLVEALVAVPLFAASEHSLFHADPHAGNLLYDADSGELVILDWALTERLTREQRRHLALLFLLLGLRDRGGVCRQVDLLREKNRGAAHLSEELRAFITTYVDELPWNRLPSAVDAMRLLEHLTLRGLRFPAPMIMLSKVLFTLDGILHDIGEGDSWMWVTIARHLAQRWVLNRGTVGSPIGVRDWLELPSTALLFGCRLGVKAEEALRDRLLPQARAVVAN